MVKTRPMAVQHDKGAKLNRQETSVSDRACPKTPRVVVLEQQIQGLTANI